MALRGEARRGRRVRKAKSLAARPRLPRCLRLGFSSNVGAISALGIGTLIGIAVAHHLIQPELRPSWSAAAVESVPRLVRLEAEQALPPPPRSPDIVALSPPKELPRSPFAPWRKAETQTPAAAGPNAAIAPPALRRDPIEPVVLKMPPSAPSDPPWRRHAVRVAVPQGRPLIAILIDDVGVNRRNALLVAELPAPLTLAYMTYADNLAKQSEAARARGHELMLHMPMEALDPDQDAGPNALLTGLEPAELRRRLNWGLDRLEGYVGVNNHMGSRFTAWEPGMTMVMEELRRRGLLFVDSRTISASLGARMAERYAVPHADRDVFLDNDEEGAAVAERLIELEAVARRRGMAIGIGHPHDGTVAALADWLPSLAEKGFVLVPVTTIVERRMKQKTKSAAVTSGPPS